MANTDIKVQARNKLDKELKDIKKQKTLAEPIVKYLMQRINESEALAADIVQEHKTIAKCLNYVIGEARGYLNGKNGAVSENIVYEWSEDYYHMDDKAAEEKRAKELADKKKKQEDKPNVDNKMETQKPSLKNEKKPETLKSEPDPKKNNKDIDGQLDMFSLLGM